MSGALLVTTAEHPGEAQVERARALAARFGARYLRRRGSLAKAMREAGVELAYVVTKVREELRGFGTSLHVHEGLLNSKLNAGWTHPLVRAVCDTHADTVAPMRSAPQRIVDATLGLAGDALHLAAHCGSEVVGVEASPTVHALLEEGLNRLRAGKGPAAAAAGRITLRAGRARDALREMGPGSAEVVYLDPIFAAPQAAQPGFELLRRAAQGEAPDEALLEEAARVASERVLIKVPPAEPLFWRFGERVRGKAVDYLVARV